MLTAARTSTNKLKTGKLFQATNTTAYQFSNQLLFSPCVPPASLRRLCCNLLPWRQWRSGTLALKALISKWSALFSPLIESRANAGSISGLDCFLAKRLDKYEAYLAAQTSTRWPAQLFRVSCATVESLVPKQPTVSSGSVQLSCIGVAL